MKKCNINLVSAAPILVLTLHIAVIVAENIYSQDLSSLTAETIIY